MSKTRAIIEGAVTKFADYSRPVAAMKVLNNKQLILYRQLCKGYSLLPLTFPFLHAPVLAYCGEQLCVRTESFRVW